MREAIERLAGAVQEWFLLGAAETRSRALPEERKGEVRALAQAGIEHLDAVMNLVGPATSAPAHTLACEAVAVLLAAHARAAGREIDGIREDPRRALADHPDLPRPAEVERALDRGRAWGTASEDDRREEVAALVEAAGALAAGLELRSPRELRRARRSRIAVVLGLCGAVALLALGVRSRATNVALHKVVTTSGLDPQSPDPAALVDGEAHGAFGARTSFAPSPWIMIDLGGSYALDEVVVFHRGDGVPDEGLPLVIESSIDAQAFTLLGRWTERYTQDAPLRLAGRGGRGRYVRVRLDRPGTLTLTEIEVHGTR